MKKSRRQTLVKTLQDTKYEELSDLEDVNALEEICSKLNKEMEFQDYTLIVDGLLYLDGNFYDMKFNKSEKPDDICLASISTIRDFIRFAKCDKGTALKIAKKIIEEQGD